MFAGAVDQMQEHAAALHMAKKAIAEAGALMGVFDQTGDVRQHEFVAVDRDHTQLRMQRREGIIRDFWFGGAHARQKRGLPSVGETHEPRVCNQLEAQPDRALFAGKPRICTARRTIGGRFEMRITETAIAALGEDGAIANLGDIGEERFIVFVENLGALRHLEHDVGSSRTGTVLAHAVAAGLRLEMLLIAIIDQGIQPIDAFSDYIAASATIAAVRTAELDELLAPKRDATRPAVARPDVHLGLIEELHGRSSRNRSTGTDEAMARMRHRPTPVHWKPHFSSTRREAGLLTRALAVRTP